MSLRIRTLRAIPNIIGWYLTRITCNHSHMYFDGGTLVCDRCYTEFPVSECLTKASGVYLEIEKRIEAESDYKRLIALAERYQREEV